MAPAGQWSKDPLTYPLELLGRAGLAAWHAEGHPHPLKTRTGICPLLFSCYSVCFSRG